MGILLNLSGIALREVVGGALKTVGLGGTGEAVVGFLTQRFTDHSQRLTKALQNANERAWKAFEVALGGESLWERCKLALASVEDKAFRDQVRAFLDISPLTRASAEHGPLFRQALQELRAARSRGTLSTGGLGPSELAREAGALARFNDPQALLDAEWRLVDQAASELREYCPNLWKLLVARPKAANRPSLLAVAMRFYFRREVESDQALFQGLAFAKWEALQETQEKGFAALTDALSRQGQRLEGMLDEIMKVLEDVRGTGEDTNIRVRGLEQQIQKLLEQLQLPGRELRPGDSMSVRSEGEQQRVRQLVGEYRALPEEQRRQRPDLLNRMGVLEAAAGELEDAQKDFQEAARTLSDPKARAEALHNVYRAALERQQWGDALAALGQAVALDPGRFAPFPFNRYEPQRILGAGGFGVVFLCQHRYLGKPVVVKALLPSELDRAITNVFAEARALEEVDHPAIVRLRDCDFADAAGTRPYLVMDYFDGMNLADYVAAHGKLSPEDVRAIACPVAEALQAAHTRGLLHRDVKPGNLLVRREGEGWKVKLIDFGLALRPEALQGKGSTQGPEARTTTGRSIAGTMHYAAPEQMGQLPGVPVGTYSDVYGFAKTCCYALFQTPQPRMQHWQQCPPELAALLDACLDETPTQRPQDFAAVFARLTGSKPPPPEHVEPRSRSECEQDMKDALEEWRTKGIPRKYFEQQGPSRIGAWQTAAQQGDAIAQWLLARCLQEGTGAQKDPQAAVAWLRRAANSGLAVAQTNLGDCYYPAEEAEKDSTEAYRGYLRGRGWRPSAVLEKDSTEAYRWYTLAAEQGFADAMRSRGDCHYYGMGVEKDLVEAVRWYRKAAEQGWAQAMVDLGDCHYYGEGVEEDPVEAARWYRKAAEMGHPHGQNSLAECYLDGDGVEQDYPRAIEWFRTAAQQGLAEAQNDLGYCYYAGKGVKKNRVEAVQWYRKAAEQGFDWAQFNLGNCYENGHGVDQDLAQAEQWYRMAADQGHRRAKNALKKLLKAKGSPSEDDSEQGDESDAADDNGLKPEPTTPAAGTFNALLHNAGISPSDVRLVRHADKRAEVGRTPYDLWHNNRSQFELYQAHQNIDKRTRLTAPYWAVFLGTPDGKTVFVGIYGVKYRGLLEQDTPMPHVDEVAEAGSCDVYELTLKPALGDLIGKLFIDWGAGKLAWVQYAANQDKPITKLPTEATGR